MFLIAYLNPKIIDYNSCYGVSSVMSVMSPSTDIEHNKHNKNNKHNKHNTNSNDTTFHLFFSPTYQLEKIGL